MLWVVSEPTPTKLKAGSADAGPAAANAAPAKPSVSAPTAARLLSLVVRWRSHPDLPVRVMGGLGYIVSLPLSGRTVGGTPGRCPPPALDGLGTDPDRHSGRRPSCMCLGCRGSAPGACHFAAHDRILRNQRAGPGLRSTVPPTAHAAPHITTASSTQRMAPTGCRPVLAAASCARGGMMPGPAVGLALLCGWLSEPSPVASPDPPDVVAPEVAET